MCGFDVCDPCRLGGGLTLAHERHGLVMHTETSKHQTRHNDRTVTTYVLEVRIDLPEAPAAHAHFGRDAGGSPLMKWLGWGLDHQVGDPLFDDAVLISNEGGTDLKPLLADVDVQTAIMELVEGGGVRLGQGFVRIRRSSTDCTPLDDVEAVPLTLLALHILRWVKSR